MGLYRQVRPDELTANGRATVVRGIARVYAATMDIVTKKKPEPEPPRRGRPPTGLTPAKDRSARSKQALLEAGGRRVTMNLPPAAAEDLATIVKRLGAGTKDTAAVVHALRETAKRRRA